MAGEPRIVISSVRPVLPDAYVTPVSVAMSEIYDTQPDIHVLEHEPSAAEGSEILLSILVLFSAGGIPLLVKFFEPLVTKLGERFRDRLLSANREIRVRGSEGRSYVALDIAIGIASDDDKYPRPPVHYFFHEEVDDAGLLERLRAADLHLKSIPVDLLSEAPEGTPGRYFWDSKQLRWRGYISRFPDESFGEEWFPPDLQGR